MNYLYGTPSENGNIGLRVGDTVTLYDGVVLPTAVWNKETHPYALVDGFTVNVIKKTKVAYLYLLKEIDDRYLEKAGTGLTADFEYVRIHAGDVLYKTTEVPQDKQYTEWAESEVLTTEKGLSLGRIQWSNEDIYYQLDSYLGSAGGLCIAGTNPIHVSGLAGYLYNGEFSTALPDGVTESEAIPVYASDPVPVLNPSVLMQGFMMGDAVKRMRGVQPEKKLVGYLYGGVGPLPEIPKVEGLDTMFVECTGVANEEFPFSTYSMLALSSDLIYNITEHGTPRWTNRTACQYSHYMLWLTAPGFDDFLKQEGMTREDFEALIDAPLDAWFIAMGTDKVVLEAEQFNLYVSDADSVIWTNTDIINEDGSTYLAASEPVPVYE